MPYNSPRRHLLQSMSLVEDILERRRREDQPLSDEEYEALRQLVAKAPRQAHQPPLQPQTQQGPASSLALDSSALQQQNSARAGTTASSATASPNNGDSSSGLQSSESMNLHRTDSTMRPGARSGVSKLRRALGLSSALAMSELLSSTRDDVSSLVNFAVSCSALNGSPVKLVQLLVDHILNFAPKPKRTDGAGAEDESDDNNSNKKKNVSAMVVEGEYLVDPLSQTMVANNGRISRLFSDRKSDVVFDKGSQAIYVAIAADGEIFGFVQISGMQSDADLAEDKKKLILATSCIAALALRTSWQLEDLDFAQRKQALLLRIANSIAGDAFATEMEVSGRLAAKSRDLGEAQLGFFFKVDDEGDLALFHKGELHRLEKVEEEDASSRFSRRNSMRGTDKHMREQMQQHHAPRSGHHVFVAAGGGGSHRGGADVADDMEEVITDESQLAALAAEQVAHSQQVLHLQQGADDGFVEVAPGLAGSVGHHSGGGSAATSAASAAGGGGKTGSDFSRSLRGARGAGGGRGVQLDLPFTLADTHSVRSILGVPVLNDENKVIGVIVLANRQPKRIGRMDVPQSFGQRDTDMLLQLSSLASIALANCRATHKLKSEKRRREAILNVVAHLNECDIRDVEEICKYVMHGAKRLLNADRSTLFLIDEEHDELYSAVADSVGTKVIRFPVGKGIAGRVALTGQAEIIADAYSDDRFNTGIDRETGYKTLSICTLPVFSKGNVVAVAQLVNKLDPRGVPIPFSNDDQETMRTFVMFAGIAIGNSRLLEFTVKAGQEAMALNSFDGTVTADSIGKLQRSGTLSNMMQASAMPPISREDLGHIGVALDKLKKLVATGDKKWDPASTDFDLFALREQAPDGAVARDFACAVAVYLIQLQGFDKIYNIEHDTLVAFVAQCRKAMRHVPYHNFFHVVDAMQTIYTMLYCAGARSFLTELESFVLLITALCHDLDHVGTNNSYHLKADTPLGILSSVSGNNSVLEVHHCNVAIQILQSPDAQLYSGLEKEDAPKAYRMMMAAILATDMARHGEMLKQFEAMVAEGYDKSDEAHRQLVMCAIMKCADVSNTVKPFDIARQWAAAVQEEFYVQGDKERARGLQVLPMNDRTLGAELAKGQVGFIQFLAAKFFGTVETLFTGFSIFTAQMNTNLATWKKMLEEAGEKH